MDCITGFGAKAKAQELDPKFGRSCERPPVFSKESIFSSRVTLLPYISTESNNTTKKVQFIQIHFSLILLRNTFYYLKLYWDFLCFIFISLLYLSLLSAYVMVLKISCSIRWCHRMWLLGSKYVEM